MTEQQSKKNKRDEFYSPRWYDIDPKKLAELKALKPYKPVLAALEAWVWIFVIVKAYLHFPGLVYFYPAVIFLIAGRAGVFLQLAHDAAHGLIARGWFNNFFGDWVTTYPIGLDFRGYAEPHMRHHACTNKICDPLSDSEKYRVCDIRAPRLWLLFLKDLLGITAVAIKFMYDKPDANKYDKEAEDYLESEEIYSAYRARSVSWQESVRKYFCIALMQLLILAVVFDFNPLHYFALWLFPLMSTHMFLMRVRGIAEHGLGIQLGVKDLKEKNRGTYYTRSFGTPAGRYRFLPLAWLERALIGSLNVYYHHEHHLFPKVPYYNLPDLHRLIWSEERQNNPYIFAKGYFDCLFFNLRREAKQSQTAPLPITA